MQLFRRVIAVLLMISLPAYGWAFTAMPTCSMQHGQKSAVATTEHGSHSCCAGQQAEHGAKSLDHSDRSSHGDAQCQCSAMYQAVQPLTALIIPPTHNPIQFSSFPSITTAALPLWRPPTAS
jgi:hypothetical protein